MVERQSTRTELVDLLTRTQRALARDLGAALEEEGTTVEQWRVLRALAGADDISMGELAAVVEIPHPTLTRLVDSLVDSAYLYRSHSTRDRRRMGSPAGDDHRSPAASRPPPALPIRTFLFSPTTSVAGFPVTAAFANPIK